MGFLNNFWGHKSFLWGHWYPSFGLLVTSPLGFKGRVVSLIHAWWRCTCYKFPDIHLGCDTCWPFWRAAPLIFDGWHLWSLTAAEPFGGQHGSRPDLFHSWRFVSSGFISAKTFLWVFYPLHNSGGSPRPTDQEFSQFHAIFETILQNCMLAPPPSPGNPGSATDKVAQKSETGVSVTQKMDTCPTKTIF